MLDKALRVPAGASWQDTYSFKPVIADHSISQESLREQVRLYIYVSEDIYIWREKHYIVIVKKKS